MVDKEFITPEELLRYSCLLARNILDSGYRPDFIAALWRGGTSPGMVVQEFLEYHHVATDHIAIRTKRYEGIDKANNKTEVYGLEYLVERVSPDKNLLFVDDVYDTGLTMKAVLEELERKARRNTPKDIRIATVYYKPSRNQTSRVPDFYVYKTEKWLVFPHEFQDLTLAEIRQGKGAEIANLFKEKPK